MKIGELHQDLSLLLIGMGFDQAKCVINLNGYPALHINEGGKKKLKYVHRLVAAHYLGASLDRWTIVHHKNEDRSDFRLENLHVCPFGDHGQFHRKFGADNQFFGRHHTAETRERLAELGRKRGAPILDEKARAKISANMKARWANGFFDWQKNTPKADWKPPC